MNNLVGTTLHHYQILVKIRETPTRVLYKAYDTKAHIHVALEVVKESRGNPSQLLELINSQAQKNAVLTHPNISAVIDSGIYEDFIYIVYNFCPTHPLRRFFNRTYSWKEMARELVSITHALAYAHEKGIAHGFLNPSSIVLDDKKNPILFDFGFEQIITNYILVHSPGAWINPWGFEYLSPEQLIGASPDWRSDIYAMGMILHEWLFGKIPFLDSTLIGTLKTRMSSGRIKSDKKTVTPLIQNLVQKCIEANPADRYQSMQEIYIILARGALDMSITKKMIQKPLAITTRRFNIGRLFIALGTVAVLVLTGYYLMNVSTAPAAQATQDTSTPTKLQPTPTLVVIKPTATPRAQATAFLSQTQLPNIVVFPLFQGSTISSTINQIITPNNSNSLIMVSLWGIGDINRLVSSDDGKYVAAASTIGIFVFDAESLILEKYIDTRSWVTAIAFSPDGETIATGDRDGLIQIWSTDTWEESAAPYSGHTKAILDLAFSPDGTRLASVGSDENLFQWQVNDNNQSPIRVHVTGATSVAYSGGSAQVVTGGNDFKINIWDAGNLMLIQSVVFSAKIVDIESGASQMVIGGADQKIAILDLVNGTTLTPMGNLQYPLTSVAISPDGNFIAGGDINGGITVWDSSGIQLWKTQNYVLGDSTFNNISGSPHSLSFSPDGKTLFSGLRNGIVRGLNTVSGKELLINQSLNAHSRKLAISHASQYAITQQDNNILTIWDIWGGKFLYQLLGEMKYGDSFSQDDSMFAVASDSSTVKVYRSSDGSEIYTLNGHEDIQTIQFIENDAQLAAGSDLMMHLWSISSGQEIKIKRNFEGQGCSTIYDLNEQPIFSITNYHYIIPRDQENSVLCNFQKLNWKIFINETIGQIAYGGNSILTVVNTRTGESRNMNGVNRKNIVSVAISPDGNILAAAFDDNTIHLWNIDTGVELFSLYGHNNLITALQFTLDGKILLSTSLDGTIRIWGVPY